MKTAEPEVFLVAQTRVVARGMQDYLRAVGGGADEWLRDTLAAEEPVGSADMLSAFGGKLCYRAWKPGLNANVTKTRDDIGEYLANVVASGHGSVLEHSSMTFVFHNVSRVLTHELVRHRPGVAISQESMRYVRLDDLSIVQDPTLMDDDELQERNAELVERMELHQKWMADHFGLDNDAVPFSEKKAKTSYMRRFAPDGVATGIMWTGNVRALRHVISMRTDPAAEQEIRIVFDKVAQICYEEARHLFSDFEQIEVEGSEVPWHKPHNWKV